MEKKADPPRRSARLTKGIPPAKLGVDSVDKNKMVSRSEAKLSRNDQKLDVEEESTTLGEKVVDPLVQNSSVVREEQERHIDEKYMSEDDSKSIRSKSSCKSRINLEMEALKLQEKFEHEESMERLRLIRNKKELAFKELELKMRMLEEDYRSVDGFQEDTQQNIQDNPQNVKDWIQRCVPVSNLEGYPDLGLPCREGKIGDRSDMLLKIVEQCSKNTENVTQILKRQKLRELPLFSGELTEWPLFINEFKRSSEFYGLNNYDNLLRLDRSLKGKARETIKPLLSSPDNVSRIIKMLEMNFGRPDWIILSLIEKVKNFGHVREDKLDTCISFSNAINNMVTTMKNIDCTLYLFNPELLSIIVEKLSPIQKYNWGKYKLQRDKESLPTSLDDFAVWYEDEIGAVASISNSVFKSKGNFKRETIFSVNSDSERILTNKLCPLCKKDGHNNVSKCRLFLDKTIPERRKITSEFKLCFSCLTLGHSFKRCYRKKICGVDGCIGRHNPLVHLAIATETSTQQNPDFCGQLTTERESVLLRIAAVILRGPNKEVTTFALFDEGSTCSLIEEELANELELSGPVVPLCFQWTNQVTHYEDDSRNVSVDIAGGIEVKRNFYEIKNLRTVRNLQLPQQNFDIAELLKKYPYLDHEVLQSLNNAKPQILLGQDNCGLIIPRQIIQPRLNMPILSKSKLGWTIHGQVSSKSPSDSSFGINFCCSNEELDILVRSSFKYEDFGSKSDSDIFSLDDTKKSYLSSSLQEDVFEKEEQKKLKQWQAKKLLELQNQCHEALKDIGAGYEGANLLDNEENILLDKRENEESVARIRADLANRKLREEKKKAEHNVSVPTLKRKLVRQMENKRAQMISGLKQSSGSFKKKSHDKLSIETEISGIVTDSDSDYEDIDESILKESNVDISFKVDNNSGNFNNNITSYNDEMKNIAENSTNSKSFELPDNDDQLLKELREQRDTRISERINTLKCFDTTDEEEVNKKCRESQRGKIKKTTSKPGLDPAAGKVQVREIPNRPKVTLKSVKSPIKPSTLTSRTPLQSKSSKSRLITSHIERITKDILIISPEPLNNDDFLEKIRQRDRDALKRGQKALERKKLQREYNDLLKKLPALQKLERLYEMNEDKPEYHMTEERLREQEKNKQSILDDTYEKLFPDRRPPTITIPVKNKSISATMQRNEILLNQDSQSLNLGTWKNERKKTIMENSRDQ